MLNVLTYIRLMRLKIGILMGLVAVSAAILAKPFDPSLKIILLIYVVSVLSGGACASFNAWLDREADILIPRKLTRPVALGLIKPESAIIFGLVLAVLAISIAWVLNPLSSLIVIGGIVGIVAYTIVKRKTPASIALASFINGFSPTLLGWVSVSGGLSVVTLILIAILAFWTLNHLSLIGLAYADEYRLIRRPTIATVYGPKAATTLALTSAVIMVTLTFLLFGFADLGLSYAILMAAAGIGILAANVVPMKTFLKEDYVRAFRFSRFYTLIFFLSIITGLFAA